ncbi:AAA family ATPase [Propionibacteriaceae bacterium Y1700]|uniref:AAA family ATPase n=1 Tax=Microlunatus sp. Y1700 TaxID=3418487 RepID=UPI003DA7372C
MEGPFFPGAGTSPYRLEGREAELREWQRVLTDFDAFGHTQARHLIISGVRGVGKTSLLKQFAEAALVAGCLAVRVRCQASGRETLMDRVDAAVAKALQESDFAAVHGRLTRAALSTPVGGFELERELGAGSPLVDTAFMDRLLAATDRVRERGGSGLALLIDETQYADHASLVNLSELVSLLGERDADKPPMFVCFAGLPGDTARMVGKSSSHAERVYRRITLGYLDADATRDAFLLPVREAGGRWTPEALELAVELSGGYPAFIQELGYQVWLHRQADPEDGGSAGLVTEKVVRAGMEGAVPQLEAYYEGAWEAAPAEGQRILLALADLGGEAAVAELARALGKESSSQIAWAVDALIKRGTVLRPARGRLVFGRAGMDQWVLQNHGGQESPAALPSTRGTD